MAEERNARPWDIFNKNITKLEGSISEERLQICKTCEHLIQLTSQCKKCGCLMNLKTKLPNAYCPVGKWHQVAVDYKKEI
jgi:hypothetical protein